MSDAVIEVKELSKTFQLGFWRRPVRAVEALSFEVKRGEIFGLIGPNGAGKTTTIKMMTGLIRPSSGQIRILGYLARDRRAAQSFGYLPELSAYYDYLTGQELLDFYAKLYGLEGTERRRKVAFWLDRVGLAQAAQKRLGRYSKGMMQRLGLAQALIGDPELLILDEPQSGLDPVGRREVAELIRECRSQGKTVFFSSHILPDVEALCDRVGLVMQGRMQCVGALSSWLSGQGDIEMAVEGEVPEALIAKFKEQCSLRCERRGDWTYLILPAEAKAEQNELLRACLDANLSIHSLQAQRASLEELFKNLDSARQTPAASE